MAVFARGIDLGLARAFGSDPKPSQEPGTCAPHFCRARVLKTEGEWSVWRIHTFPVFPPGFQVLSVADCFKVSLWQSTGGNDG